MANSQWSGPPQAGGMCVENSRKFRGKGREIGERTRPLELHRELVASSFYLLEILNFVFCFFC